MQTELQSGFFPDLQWALMRRWFGYRWPSCTWTINFVGKTRGQSGSTMSGLTRPPGRTLRRRSTRFVLGYDGSNNWSKPWSKKRGILTSFQQCRPQSTAIQTFVPSMSVPWSEHALREVDVWLLGRLGAPCTRAAGSLATLPIAAQKQPNGAVDVGRELGHKCFAPFSEQACRPKTWKTWWFGT